MHTFFINTSRKDLNGYEVLFDIHYENKALVSMHCPMAGWYDTDEGYAVCVKQMGDMIDGYAEMNNAFNLIIYIDLSEYEAYTSIRRDAFHDRERDECCRAMHILFTHVISESILDALVNEGRRPQNLLILFGEEKRFTDFYVSGDDPDRTAVMQKLFGFIGLPGEAEIESVARAVEESGEADKTGVLRTRLCDACGKELVPGIRKSYSDDLDLWCCEIMDSANIPQAGSDLFDRIQGINSVESDRMGVEILSCPYDCYACRVNKSALALSQLNVALHVLKCVEAASIYRGSSDTGVKQLMEFHAYTVEEVVPLLAAKEALYAGKVSEIEELATSYSELGLAPQLSVLDHKKFGLDEYGDRDLKLTVTDAEPDTQAEKEKKDDDPEAAIVAENGKKVMVSAAEGRTLLECEDFQKFDYTYEQNTGVLLTKKATAEQYIEEAKNVRRHHLDYLKKLQNHVSDLLSNYAGKSKENKPAMLQVGGCRYAAAGRENRVLESVGKVSEKAYGTVLDQYLEFCAGRSVAMTDVEEQCNWLITRVCQVRESLRKMKYAALGLLAAILFVYLPFVILQYEAIRINLLTITVGLCSVAVPLVVLYLVFAIAAALQKRKYRKFWKQFKEKADAALAENTAAAKSYDELLLSVIPALRWVYEYRLDVEYCTECCSVAGAKIEHHRRKLRSRISAIRNMLTDLEYKAPETAPVPEKTEKAVDAIDYNMAFCTGEKNRAFYAVIDRDLLGLSGT